MAAVPTRVKALTNESLRVRVMGTSWGVRGVGELVGAPGYGEGDGSPRRPAGFNDATHAPRWVEVATQNKEWLVAFLPDGKGS